MIAVYPVGNQAHTGDTEPQTDAGRTDGWMEVEKYDQAGLNTDSLAGLLVCSAAAEAAAARSSFPISSAAS